MQLLCELLGIQEKIGETLLEDLGSIKKAGLGRMVNAFKQSYYFHSGIKTDVGPHTSDVGKTIHGRMTGIGKNSEIVTIDQPITGWIFVKKMYAANSPKRTGKGKPMAVVFYVAGKAVAMIIMSEDSFASSRHVVGLSWDFTGVGDESDAAEIIDGIEPHDHTAKHELVSKETHPSKSEQTHTFRKPDNKVEVRHYQGIGVLLRDAASFVERLAKVFDGEVKMKLILSDQPNHEEEPTEEDVE